MRFEIELSAEELHNFLTTFNSVAQIIVAMVQQLTSEHKIPDISVKPFEETNPSTP